LSDSSEGQRRALLVGINHYYLDDTIGNLQYCVNDVVELDEILSNKLRGDFSTQLLHSEIDDIKQRPTRSNIMALTSLLANNSESNDSILFYFAGHGFEQDGVNYLLPADARENVLSETAISLRWVKETLSRSLARKKFMIMDACHAGAAIGRSQSVHMTRSFHEEMFSEAEGFAVLSSCKMGQLSHDYPETNHGAFSYYLLEGLRGLADRDGDQIITVPDANKYVSQKLREWSLSRGVQQNPTFEYRVSGDFIFVRIPTEGGAELPSKFDIADMAIAPAYDVSYITKTLDDLSFMSFEDINSNRQLFENLRASLSSGDKVTKIKIFLTKFVRTRFSDSEAKERLMSIVASVTELKEVKKWIGNEPLIKQYLLIEFTTSRNFDYAGTMAHIIRNILPVLSDDELREIVGSIEQNDQILNSFKARAYLWSIIDASKYIVSIERYKDLMKLLTG